MKIEAFATLEAVLRLGSMTAAAAEMSITPGAVSLQIKQIETYLGQTLFDRSGRAPSPTPLAFDTAALMGKALQDLNAMRKSRTITASGIFRLGVIDSVQTVLLPKTFVYLRRVHPLVTLKPVRGKAAELIQAVKAGELDAAVARRAPAGGEARLNWHPVLRRELKLLAPPGSTETGLHELLANHEWIMLDRSTIMGALASKYVRSHFGERRNVLEFDSIPTIVSMVSAGVGVALVVLPEPKLASVWPVRVLRLPDSPVLEFSLVSRRADNDSRLMLAVRQALDVTAADRQEEIVAG
jgi:DNA-binding transcriptional LysR family regulator